jgi:hypothetical protein
MKLTGIALFLFLCLAPLVAEAQSAGKVYRIARHGKEQP